MLRARQKFVVDPVVRSNKDVADRTLALDKVLVEAADATEEDVIGEAQFFDTANGQEAVVVATDTSPPGQAVITNVGDAAE
ncbi:hypothetical protein MMC18_008765 [Xylographa bjoerkii]|nr:hypothetical protein [Xylographa bjoerkii]